MPGRRAMPNWRKPGLGRSAWPALLDGRPRADGLCTRDSIGSAPPVDVRWPGRKLGPDPNGPARDGDGSWRLPFRSTLRNSGPSGRLEGEPATNRLNDGKVGPDGAFWVGTMDDRAVKEAQVDLARAGRA